MAAAAKLCPDCALVGGRRAGAEVSRCGTCPCWLGADKGNRDDIPDGSQPDGNAALAFSCVIQGAGAVLVSSVSSVAGDAGVVLCCRFVLGALNAAKIQVGASGSFCFQTEDSVAFIKEGAPLNRAKQLAPPGAFTNRPDHSRGAKSPNCRGG